MKKDVKSVVDVEGNDALVTCVSDFVSNIPDGETLMGLEVTLGMSRDGKEKFTVCFNTFIGDMDEVRNNARQRFA